MKKFTVLFFGSEHFETFSKTFNDFDMLRWFRNEILEDSDFDTLTFNIDRTPHTLAKAKKEDVTAGQKYVFFDADFELDFNGEVVTVKELNPDGVGVLFSDDHGEMVTSRAADDLYIIG